MAAVDDAISRGCAYVAAEQGEDGRWRDASLRAAEGSDWVTAYVARALAVLLAAAPWRTDLVRTIETAHHALAAHQRGNGGWASSAHAPTDSESTSWALWSLLDEPRLRLFFTGRGRRYLRAHRDAESGGFVPYSVDVDPSGPGASRLPAALLRPQACVTAVAARVLADKDPADPVVLGACDYLKRSQDADGLWRSDLWAVAGGVTLVALGTLHTANRLDPATFTATRDGLAVLMKDAHGFELASALITAPRLDLADFDGALDRLLAEQDPDGGWTPPSPVRTDLFADLDPTRGPGNADVDHGRLLTTATALAALGLQP